MIKAELNAALIAMNPQSNCVMSGQSVGEETSTSEDEEDTKGHTPEESTPVLGGAHGPVVTKWWGIINETIYRFRNTIPYIIYIIFFLDI